LIENNVTWILVPANDPYSLAYKIKELCVSLNQKKVEKKFSTEVIKVATSRHNLGAILINVVSIYKTLYANLKFLYRIGRVSFFNKIINSF
jgi:hypothetical protein